MQPAAMDALLTTCRPTSQHWPISDNTHSAIAGENEAENWAQQHATTLGGHRSADFPPSAPRSKRASKRWPFFVSSYRTATAAIRSVRANLGPAPRLSDASGVRPVRTEVEGRPIALPAGAYAVAPAAPAAPTLGSGLGPVRLRRSGVVLAQGVFDLAHFERWQIHKTARRVELLFEEFAE